MFGPLKVGVFERMGEGVNGVEEGKGRGCLEKMFKEKKKRKEKESGRGVENKQYLRNQTNVLAPTRSYDSR